jgi:hypothetical protein
MEEAGRKDGFYDPSAEYYRQQGTFFCTEKINLPRGNVVPEDSLRSSPSHGFRQQTSSRKITEEKGFKNSPDGGPSLINLKSCSPTKWNDMFNSNSGQNNLGSLNQLRMPKRVGVSTHRLKPGELSPNKVAKEYMQHM